MQKRAANRRQRRARLWYRKRRFNNRSSSKRAFRLPVSIKAIVFQIINFTRANTYVRPYVKYFIVGADHRECPLGNYLSEHL
ncbi:MAG: hypothetical protein DRQ57_01965 [Gammaproteobacteria bacterium]|nr:MAG: hypothetical protein DRQ57_01965 [Gammaproteobacteria bacterium]